MERVNKNCALPKACGKLVVELEIVHHLVLGGRSFFCNCSKKLKEGLFLY